MQCVRWWNLNSVTLIKIMKTFFSLKNPLTYYIRAEILVKCLWKMMAKIQTYFFVSEGKFVCPEDNIDIQSNDVQG